jgi:Metallo-beta-lactamase superfamily domain
MEKKSRNNLKYRCAPTIDLVLLSHGDLSHCGLYPYAYSRWGLKCPTYTTLPVQAMGRIATTEDVEGIRDEEDVDDEGEKQIDGEESNELDETEESKKVSKIKGKYVATLQDVQDSFDAINTLRYSQPTHLQGGSYVFSARTAAKQPIPRKVPRSNNNTVQCWPYPGRHHLENSLPFSWYNSLCSGSQPYARTTSRWDSLDATSCRRCI